MSFGTDASDRYLENHGVQRPEAGLIRAARVVTTSRDCAWSRDPIRLELNRERPLPLIVNVRPEPRSSDDAAADTESKVHSTTHSPQPFLLVTRERRASRAHALSLTQHRRTQRCSRAAQIETRGGCRVRTVQSVQSPTSRSLQKRPRAPRTTERSLIPDSSSVFVMSR
jgi:hypothetical protein